MALFPTRREVRSHGARVSDLGEGTLAPGTVAAHTHLELTGLAVPPPRRDEAPGDFVAWVRAVLGARREGRLDAGGAARAGARRLLASGTTAVGDVDATGAAALAAAQAGLRVRAFREVLDGGDPARLETALDLVGEPLAETSLVAEGLSPHAPHTVSNELLDRVAELVRERGVPVSMHWAESLDEIEWLERGEGAFADLLGESPGADSIQRLEERGLLGPATSLVHANWPRPGDPERIAAAGATVVHCPGSHLYFRRAPFALEAWRRAGVTVALGTDSEASNAALDLGREVRLLREAHPALSPAEAWAHATLAGARALGWEGRVGTLDEGAFADFCLYATPAGASADTDLDAMTTGAADVVGTWVGGRRVPPSP